MNHWKRVGVICAGIFLGLFVLRLAYTLSAGEPERAEAAGESFEFARKNYASEKQAVSNKDALMLSSQKYEKVATLSSRSSQFESDEKKLRQSVAEFKGVIQFEQNSGLPGRRILHVAVGVHPDRFDDIIASLRGIGRLTGIHVNKTDKTSDYKDLNAKRISLEKYRAGLLALKGRNGKIEELISLEQKILEIEKEIQEKGVQLGEFDAENEFCTVKFSLYEGGASGKGFLRKTFDAFEWAVLWSLGLAFFYLFCVAGLWISLRLFERGKKMFIAMRGAGD